MFMLMAEARAEICSIIEISVTFHDDSRYDTRHGNRTQLSPPRRHSQRSDLYPQPHYRASRIEQARIVQESVPGVELGAGEWRAAGHGVPGSDAAVASRGPYRAAAGEVCSEQSAGPARPADED